MIQTSISRSSLSIKTSSHKRQTAMDIQIGKNGRGTAFTIVAAMYCLLLSLRSHADFPPGLTKPPPDPINQGNESSGQQNSSPSGGGGTWTGDFSRLSGDWVCVNNNVEKSLQDGMVQVFGIPPARGYVLVLSVLSWRLHFNTQSGNSSGTVARVFEERVATPQEKQTSAISDIKNGFSLGFSPETGTDLCVIARGGQCQAAVTWADTYAISGGKMDEHGAQLMLGQGVCSGLCGRDPYKTPGKKLELHFHEGNPGFYIGWPNQEHYQYCSRTR